VVYVQMSAEIIWKDRDLKEARREFRLQTDDRSSAQLYLHTHKLR